MTIGRFAQLSGLSITALRYYDEAGLFVDAPDRLHDELDRWRCDQAVARADQDAAITTAERLLSAYDRDVPVVRREAPEQHYLGVVLAASVLGDDPEAGVAVVQDAWQRVDAVLVGRGTTGTGAWTTVRPEEPGAPAHVVLCTGLSQPWADATVAPLERGTLPPRGGLRGAGAAGRVTTHRSRRAALAPGQPHRDARAPVRTKAVAMGLRTAVTALVQQRRHRRASAAVSEHETARAVRRTPPTTRDVAVGGQTGSTVA